MLISSISQIGRSACRSWLWRLHLPAVSPEIPKQDKISPIFHVHRIPPFRMIQSKRDPSTALGRVTIENPISTMLLTNSGQCSSLHARL